MGVWEGIFKDNITVGIARYTGNKNTSDEGTIIYEMYIIGSHLYHTIRLSENDATKFYFNALLSNKKFVEDVLRFLAIMTA